MTTFVSSMPPHFGALAENMKIQNTLLPRRARFHGINSKKRTHTQESPETVPGAAKPYGSAAENKRAVVKSGINPVSLGPVERTVSGFAVYQISPIYSNQYLFESGDRYCGEDGPQGGVGKQYYFIGNRPQRCSACP